ncbi:DNA-binding transcriptional LysR family regulator [Clostridium algifaecis]|uniref:DNA-binding transcriptional LysR family regulator n=1 Tax=Clostridium algifaecis TaxID=1472040 RepID=A0ABS4KT40_9CLOT|nr:LysR family transcriptional regulator [Clostridium algifaecis]MBP2032019.1 DNA-binding transcriptional LysR family regulator [Clostridium algifaecis]
MTILEIDAFLMVVKIGSITAAAEQLYVTQPALSRRIAALEKELGYSLMERGKGIRSIKLTEKGKAFVAVAHKWKMLWGETGRISKLDGNLNLNISAIGSLLTYIFPEVFQKFLNKSQDLSLSIQNHHSYEAYSFIESGLADIAFISDAMYSKNVETIPAFREPMVFVAGKNVSISAKIHPSRLDVAHEIKIPWSPQFDIWHDYWFNTFAKPRVTLDQMSMMEYFLDIEKNWAVVPVSVALKIAKTVDIEVCKIEDGPPDRIIYYILGKQPKKLIKFLLQLLDKKVKNIEGVNSYL